MKQPLYEYKDNSTADKVLMIRANVSFELGNRTTKGKEMIPFIASNTWSILCENSVKNYGYVYNKITDAALREILHNDKVRDLKADILRMFIYEFKGAKKPHPEHEFDERDPLFKKRTKFHQHTKVREFVNYGIISCEQLYYFDVKNSNFRTTVSSKQLSGFCYDATERKFYGQHHHPKTRRTDREEVDRAWLADEFGEEYVDFLIKRPITQQIYVCVPVGNAKCLTITEDISMNPVVKYTQSGSDSCTFTSLASALFYIGCVEEAEQLDKFRAYFLENLFAENAHRIMECIINHMMNEACFANLRRKFVWKRLGSEHNLCQAEIPIGEIRWINMWDSAGGVNHAISVVDNWIFEGNLSNALEFNKDNLDECCEPFLFDSVRKGYHFVVRNTSVGKSNYAKKRRNKRKIAELECDSKIGDMHCESEPEMQCESEPMLMFEHVAEFDHVAEEEDDNKIWVV